MILILVAGITLSACGHDPGDAIHLKAQAGVPTFYLTVSGDQVGPSLHIFAHFFLREFLENETFFGLPEKLVS